MPSELERRELAYKSFWQAGIVSLGVCLSVVHEGGKFKHLARSPSPAMVAQTMI